MSDCKRVSKIDLWHLNEALESYKSAMQNRELSVEEAVEAIIKAANKMYKEAYSLIHRPSMTDDEF